jgi:hypothetical protein
VVLAPGDEEQRGARVVSVVHPGLLVPGPDVGDETVGPDPVPRCGDVVALVDLQRFLFAQGVGEGVMELLRGEADRLVAVRRFLRMGKNDLICEGGERNRCACCA